MKNIFILILAGCTCNATAQTPAKCEIKFAQKAAEGSMMEVKLGELGVSHAVTSEVKANAQLMINDHSKANDELKSIAAKKNITLPASISDKEQKMYDKLAKLSGKDFDKKYTKCMIKDHKMD